MKTLDIFADPVCPFCLLGKAHLDRALESRADHGLQITWHPFRLNPDMPAGGMARADYLRAKFGARADAVTDQTATLLAGIGLTANPSPVEPATLDAHRLMHWAGIEGAQSRVMDGLLRAHWTEAADLGDAAVLAGVATRAGMDGAMVARLLASDADRDAVLAREAHARERGIRAVPTFIVAGAHVVSGAQPPDLWQRVIDELASPPTGG